MRLLLGLLTCGAADAWLGGWFAARTDRKHHHPQAPARPREVNATAQPGEPSRYSMEEERTVLPSLERALRAVSSELGSLVKYYGGDPGVLLRAKQSKRPNNDVLLRERLAEAFVGGHPFTIGVIGGAHTANRHGWADEAWPHILQRRLEHVFPDEFAVRTAASWWRDARSLEDAFCLGELVGNDVDVVIREWSPTYGRTGAFADGLSSLPPKQAKLMWNANITGRKHLSKSARLVAPRELASAEIQMRQVWNLPQRPALIYVASDFDGGDDASTLRTALEKGGVFGDAYHKFSLTFLSAFGQTFKKDPYRYKRKPHRRLTASKRTEAKRKARASRHKKPVVAPQFEGPRVSDGVHTFARRAGVPDGSPDSWRTFWKETKPLMGEAGLSPLGHELIGNQVAFRLLLYANESLSHFLHAATPRSDIERLLRHRERRRAALATRTHVGLPPPVLCAGTACAHSPGREGSSHHPRPLCASSSLPKAPAARDVGDLISNTSQHTRWRNLPVSFEAHVEEDLLCADEASRACYEVRRKQSHTSQIRGFVGDAGSGELQLDLEFRKHASCVAVIAEAPVVSKNVHAANWHAELEVRVEGQPCAAPACTVTTIPNAGSRLVVDLTKVAKLEDRESCWVLNPVHVDLRVVPAKIPAHACAALARPMRATCRDCAPAQGSCRETGSWAAYDLGCRAGADGACARRGDDDRSPRLAVSTVVLF